MSATERRAYLVCATQRSGSTLLCELLGATGVAGHPREYFEAMHDTGCPPHPRDFLAGAGDSVSDVRDHPAPPEAPSYSSLGGIGDYREHLVRSVAAGTTANGVFGAKLMFNQLAELRALVGPVLEYTGLDPGELLSRMLGASGDLAYVWVSRRDKVAQAVSLWTALQSRRWRGGSPGLPDASPRYDFAGIDHLVSRLDAEDKGWRSFFATHGIEPLPLGYEDDIAPDPTRAVGRVLEFLGLPSPSGPPASRPLQRQADQRSADWVAAYHRDRARPATSLTG